MDDSGKIIVDALVKMNKAIDLAQLKQMLKKLTEYKKSSMLDEPKKFDELIEKICSHLSDDYALKFKKIDFYASAEKESIDDDLPF